MAYEDRFSDVEIPPDRAIEIATRAGMKLRIAAKVDNADLSYWQEEIEPLVRANPLVEYVGEIGEREKADFLGQATARSMWIPTSPPSAPARRWTTGRV